MNLNNDSQQQNEFSFKLNTDIEKSNTTLTKKNKLEIDTNNIFNIKDDENSSPKFGIGGDTGNESPKFGSNLQLPEIKVTPINNLCELPSSGLDISSTIQHQLEMKNDSHYAEKHNKEIDNSREYARKSHLEYLRIMKENNDPIGVKYSGGLKPYTIEEVKKHNKKDDLWMVINKDVFNVTMYLDYHPGGEKKLLLGAGRDATSLFNKYHPWVNYHNLIGKLQVGYLVPSTENSNKEKEEVIKK